MREEVSGLNAAEMEAEGKAREILDAAARVFALCGFRKTNMGDIVREAGVARATLYKYYGSKEDVFHAVLMREGTEMLESVREAVALETTAAGKLRTAIITHTDVIRLKTNVLRVSLDAAADIMSKWRNETNAMTEKALDLYEEILTSGAESGELAIERPREVALQLMYMLKGLFIGVLTGYVGTERDSLVDGILNTILNGLRPREEGV